MALNASNMTLQSVGSYDLIEKIAEGGMGSIYKGRHRESGQIVAIKIMPPHMANNPVLLQRFHQEFTAASKLEHPNVVRALDFGKQGDTPYLVMEFVDGESLGARLEREGRLPVQEAIRLIVQVAQGLHRAHKLGMIHRDVKPDNVLITRDGVAKLADLGLVKDSDTDLNLTKTGRGLGTPHFMAPEQFRNAKNADVRCDVYSLGATLYMLVTGELPFRSNGPLDAWMKKVNNELTPPRKLFPEIPERTEWAILRAMSADPEKRPSSCREFVEDLTGHSTRKVPHTDSSAPLQDLWYLVYRDEEGVQHTVKGTTAAIRRSLKEGLLGDASNIVAARTKQGPFQSLRTYPEFRDLVVEVPMLSQPIQPSPTAATTPYYPAYPQQQAASPPASPTPYVQAPAPVPAEIPAVAPHIDLGPHDEEHFPEWLKWVIFLALVAVVGALLAIVVPTLLK